MHDAVLDTCQNVLLEQGVNCLRFNFRGVGSSSGRYDYGEGELEDVLSAVAWIRAEQPNDTLWLLGYSFGAMMVMKNLLADAVFPTPERAILIAPPISAAAFTSEPGGEQSPVTNALPPSCRTTMIAGSVDDYVDTQFIQAEQAEHWPGLTLELLDGADHFFSGQHNELARVLGDVIRAT